MRTAIASVVLLAAIASCKPSTKRLDEAMMYDGPRFQLKVVRYYEKYPMHYNGEVFRVVCSSANTSRAPSHLTQDSGWVTLGGGGAIGTRNAQEIVDHERKNYTVVNDSTLVWTSIGFNVSFDACGSRKQWHPTMLAREEIDTIPKPAHCAPVGTGDCRHYDFLGERQPRFSDISVGADGVFEFTATSPAFRARTIRVRSTDAGTTWTHAAVDTSAAR